MADYCRKCGKGVWCKCGLCLICHPHRHPKAAK